LGAGASGRLAWMDWGRTKWFRSNGRKIQIYRFEERGTGEANPDRDEQSPLDGLQVRALPTSKRSAGGHLWRMLWEEARVTPWQYINAFVRVNLVVGKWDAERARAASLELHSSLQRRHVGSLEIRSVVPLGTQRWLSESPIAIPQAFTSIKFPTRAGVISGTMIRRTEERLAGCSLTSTICPRKTRHDL
jgi:hypothetical protein